MSKCIVPNCGCKIPPWRERDGLITCSKKCSNAWHRIPLREREKIRGKRYNRK